MSLSFGVVPTDSEVYYKFAPIFNNEMVGCYRAEVLISFKTSSKRDGSYKIGTNKWLITLC